MIKLVIIDFMKKIEKRHLGISFDRSNQVDNRSLIRVNELITEHPIEQIGKVLRSKMELR